MSSMSLTSKASMASWMANNVVAWKWRSILKSCATSLISLATHSFLHSNSVLLWYFLICQSATVPGWNLWGFLMAPVNADLLLLPGFFLGSLAGQLLMRGLSNQIGTFPGPLPFISIIIIKIIPRRWFPLSSLCRLPCSCGQCWEGIVLLITGVSSQHPHRLWGSWHSAPSLWCSTTGRCSPQGLRFTTTSTYTLSLGLLHLR